MLLVFIYHIYTRIRAREDSRTQQLQILEENFHNVEVEQASRAKSLHDLKHQLHAIQAMLEGGKVTEAEEKLEKVLGELKKGSAERWCENATVNAVLNGKVTEARERGIRVETDIDVFTCQIDTMEMCIIFANLLDNAIEANEGANDPWIRVKIRQQDGRLSIQISNHFAKKPVEVGGQLKTTKEDARHHGFGVQNVRELVEKHWGSLTYEYDDEVFKMDVMMW